jgi:hypothetical protein
VECLRPSDLPAVRGSAKNLNPSRSAVDAVLRDCGQQPLILRSDEDVRLLLEDLRT